MTRSRRGKGGHGGGGGGHGGGDERWLVTYADLLTLLMVLFLVLWVISTIDLKKFEEFKGGLGDFGNPAAAADVANSEPVEHPAAESTTTSSSIAGEVGPGDGTGGGNGPLDAGELSGMVAQITGAIAASGLGDVVTVTAESRGLVVSVSTDNVLFGSGSGTLTPDGAQIIGTVAPELAALPNDIEVDGHTDSRPLKRTDNYDNWDLSMDRAVSVVKLLRDVYGVAPARLSSRGYADQKPKSTGTDEASLASNRRVEIVVLAGPTP